MNKTLKVNEILNIRRAVDVLREAKINLPFDLSVDVGHFYKTSEPIESSLKDSIKELEKKYNNILDQKRNEIRSQKEKDEQSLNLEIRTMEMKISQDLSADVTTLTSKEFEVPTFEVDKDALKQMYQAFPVEFFVKLPDSFMKQSVENKQPELSVVK